jgi:hypothetical protein
MTDWSNMVAHEVKPPWHKRPRFWLEVQAGNCQYRELEALQYGSQGCAFAWGCLAITLYLISQVLP